jgi:glutamate mutase epsilon subunit
VVASGWPDDPGPELGFNLALHKAFSFKQTMERWQFWANVAEKYNEVGFAMQYNRWLSKG